MKKEEKEYQKNTMGKKRENLVDAVESEQAGVVITLDQFHNDANKALVKCEIDRNPTHEVKCRL